MDDRILSEIQNVIDSRKGGNPDESYVAGLLAKGGDKIIDGSPKNSLSAISCYGGAPADEKQIVGLPNKQIAGSCIIDTAAKK